jgi:hypothetical protein
MTMPSLEVPIKDTSNAHTKRSTAGLFIIPPLAICTFPESQSYSNLPRKLTPRQEECQNGEYNPNYATLPSLSLAIPLVGCAAALLRPLGSRAKANPERFGNGGFEH